MKNTYRPRPRRTTGPQRTSRRTQQHAAAMVRAADLIDAPTGLTQTMYLRIVRWLSQQPEGSTVDWVGIPHDGGVAVILPGLDNMHVWTIVDFTDPQHTAPSIAVEALPDRAQLDVVDVATGRVVTTVTAYLPPLVDRREVVAGMRMPAGPGQQVEARIAFSAEAISHALETWSRMHSGQDVTFRMYQPAPQPQAVPALPAPAYA
jgi:hypothetical protein